MDHRLTKTRRLLDLVSLLLGRKIPLTAQEIFERHAAALSDTGTSYRERPVLPADRRAAPRGSGGANPVVVLAVVALVIRVLP